MYAGACLAPALLAWQTSGLPLVDSELTRPVALPKQEDTRPSVFLLSYAAAYAGWYQVWTADMGVCTLLTWACVHC